MSSSFGSQLQYTLFGEAHSVALGITVQGLPSGFRFNFDEICAMLTLRRGGESFNTTRAEPDAYQLLSGYYNNQTTGGPFTVIFPNADVRSQDYAQFIHQPRPGHSDHVAKVKYKAANDPRGGGQFSGRMTTPLVFLGGMVLQLIRAQHPAFAIHSHINQLQDIQDEGYYPMRKQAIASAFNLPANTKGSIDAGVFLDTLENDKKFASYCAKLASLETNFSQLDKAFPVLDNAKARDMRERIRQIKAQQSTLGGTIETIVFHPPIALGEPFFCSVESLLSSLLFSIGSVKAVGFGYGNTFSSVTGSEVKDELIEIQDDKIATLYNYNGGINGGITNGEDIVITTTCKPISSIQQLQHTYNTATQQIEPLTIEGRHDVTIVNRIIPVIEAMIVIGLYDLLLAKKRHEA